MALLLFSSTCFWFCSILTPGANYEVKTIINLITNFFFIFTKTTIIFRSNQPKIDEFITGKLSAAVLSKYWFLLGGVKPWNHRMRNQDKFPIRESMFKNSNYLDIWNKLTEYYKRVSDNNYMKKNLHFIWGEYSGAGWRQVYRGSTSSPARRGEIPWYSILLHRPELHT